MPDTLREKVWEIVANLSDHGTKAIDADTDAILALTSADAREREQKAFVAGWEDVLESDYDEEMKQLAEAEAARRYKP